MDYRERKYYLVRLNDESLRWWNVGYDNFGRRYNKYLDLFKSEIPSLKISSPYNHIKTNPNKNKWDGAMSSIGYVQMLFSCRKCDVDKIEELFMNIKKNDNNYFKVVEITKEICGQ